MELIVFFLVLLMAWFYGYLIHIVVVGAVGLALYIWYFVAMDKKRKIQEALDAARKAEQAERAAREAAREAADKAEREAAWDAADKARREDEEAERAALRKELEELRQTPTSSTGGIRGYRITRQIKMIAVDQHSDQDDAELDFFRQVRACGGTGVINMNIRRHRGAFISIQGDAVVLE